MLKWSPPTPKSFFSCGLYYLFISWGPNFGFAVIDGLDHLKKENPGARDGIRFLESEFRKGNRWVVLTRFLDYVE